MSVSIILLSLVVMILVRKVVSVLSGSTPLPRIVRLPQLAHCGVRNFLRDIGVVHRITQSSLFVYELIFI
jgi:hypothetical protein